MIYDSDPNPGSDLDLTLDPHRQLRKNRILIRQKNPDILDNITSLTSFTSLLIKRIINKNFSMILYLGLGDNIRFGSEPTEELAQLSKNMGPANKPPGLDPVCIDINFLSMP